MRGIAIFHCSMITNKNYHIQTIATICPAKKVRLGNPLEKDKFSILKSVYHLFKFTNLKRSAFPITTTSDIAINRAAQVGFKKPIEATGIATIL